MNDKTQTRDFKGIWIPKEIWLAEDLTLQEKVFFVEIDSLDNEKGCFAGNDYFVKFFGVCKRRVTEIIASLAEKGFISITIDKAQGNRRTIKALWKKSSIPSRRKVPQGIEEKFQYNNTDNNTVRERAFAPVTDSEALALYKQFFPYYQLSIHQQTIIENHVTDLAAWRKALAFWSTNDYRPQSVGKMCEKYDELLTEERKTKVTADLPTVDEVKKQREEFRKTQKLGSPAL